MQKLILLSVILATFGIPAALLRRPNAARGFRSVLLSFAAFTLVYVLLVLFVYPRLS